MVSASFNVGLRQGCALSPLVFSLYINSLVDSSAEKQGLRLNVRRGQRIPALLYANDIVILADDERMLRRVLNGMGEWCVE